MKGNSKKSMPDYSILITKTAQKQLDKLPISIAENLITVIKSLAKIHDHLDIKDLRAGMAIVSERATTAYFMIFMINFWLLKLLL
jgi:hypothetical protein